MNKIKNETGNKYGRLTVVARQGVSSGGCATWRCICMCGKEVVVRGDNLRNGGTVSCGCWSHDRIRNMNLSHGMSHTSTHNIWLGMIQRCTDKKFKAYHNYGGRGISVCDSWLESFDSFHADMGDRPIGMSLDRIDNNGNYEPSNCRWASSKTQARNSRGAKLNEVAATVIRFMNDRGVSISRLAKAHNVGYSTISCVVRNKTWVAE